MPLCPQITNTPITVTQTADFTVTSVVPAVPDTSDGLAQTIDSIQVLVDGKTKVYRQTTAPSGPDVNDGDLWFDTDDGNKLYMRVSGSWVSVQDNAIATAQATADSKVKTFYQTNAPTASEIGDIWFDTDDGFKQYYWTGSAWTSVRDTGIAAAQTAAAAAQTAATAAQTTADGKNKVFRQTNAPTASAVGDIWFDTDDDNRIYRWDGSSWVANNLGNNAITSLSANKLTAGTIDAAVITVSNINAGNISTGTLAADRIAAASITGSKLVANTITASQIATGTITADQIAASTITGAKIAAATITADNIAANTITAAKIAAGTITATEIAAGTITTDKLSAGTLTGFTVQTSSGTYAVIMNGASNALQFKVAGSISGNVLPLGVAGILMHYGSTPDSNGTTYPKVQLSFSTALIAASASIYVQSTTTGNSASGDFRCFNTFQVDGSATFNSTMFAPNLSTSTSATNLRVATGTIGEIQETSASSIRFKENIVDVNTVEEVDPKKLLELSVRAFTYKADYLSESDDRFGAILPGFIAEEVDAIYPVAADYGDGQPHSWNERFIIPGMLALIQDLYKEIATLKGE